MISFDHNGNLVPYSFIRLNTANVFKYFVDDFPQSIARPVLYDHFLVYVTDLTLLLDQPLHQWLGGSFISTKIDPNDVDCVNLIVFNENLEQSIDSLIPYLLIDGSREKYYVDGHLIAVYPSTDERYNAITLPSLNYWRAFLMKDRQDNPRGIIELIDAD